MKKNDILRIFVALLCIITLTAGCTTSVPAGGTSQTLGAPQGTSAVTTPAAESTTPACPDKLVWDGAWDSQELGMAGNHDLSTAWTKYKDRAYGDHTTVTMKQTCWDVEGSFSLPGIKCNVTFEGTVDKNILTGTWSGSKTCSKGEEGRKFSLTMAADNQSWLGDLYDSSQDPANFPPNWAGRRAP